MATGNLGNLPASFPNEIATLLTDAIDDTYAAADRPAAGNLSAATFADAYIGAYAVFWFLTSGEGVVANNVLATPPGNCGTSAPSWITNNSSPSPQQAGLNIPGAVCAAILAILALLACLFGDIPAGLALLAAALAAPAINWDEVACNLYWLNSVLLAQENALRDALVYGALAYPPPILLGGQVNGNTQPATDLTHGERLRSATMPPSPGFR
jgi:hypothetical protein